MSDWQPLVLGSSLQHLFDHRGRTPKKLGADFVSSGVQVISAKLVSDGRLNLDRERRFVSPEVYARWMPVALAEGDVLLTSEAPLGEAALVPAGSTLCLGQRLFGLRPDPDVLDARFLYYWLRSPAGRSALSQRSSGTTVVGIRQSELVQVEVPAPRVQVQRVVGEVLASFDDLIDSNRRRVQILEQMVSKIYREWFVYFRYPGYGTDALIESPIGPIPDGWIISPLVEIADITMGQSPRSEFYNSDGDGKPFHQGVADFGAHFPVHRKYCTVDTRLAEDGDVLVSVRAPVGRINQADTTLVIGRGLAAIRSRLNHQSLLLAALKEVFAEEDSMGGGTIFNAIGKKELEQVRIVRPPSALAARAEEVLAPEVGLIRELTFANRKLAAMRDLLIPRLTTGQIDVSHLTLDLSSGAATT